MYTFGYWLKDQMRARRIPSVGRLAREAGLDPGRVADWVLGNTQPSPMEAARLARYLGVPVGRLGAFIGELSESVRRGA